MKQPVLILAVLALAVLCVPAFAQDDAEPVANPNSPSGMEGDLAIQFKGVSSVGAEDPEGLLNIIEGPITIETWAQIDDYADFWTGMVSWGFTYKMGISNPENGTNFLFTFYGIVDIFSGYDLSPFIGDGQWHHYAAVWEPDFGVTFYVDGVDSGFAEVSGAPREPTTTNFTVGGENNGNVPFIGSMDRVRIHQAILTAEDLDSDAANPKAPLENTLVHYDFDEGAAPYASSGSVSLDLNYQNPVGLEASADNWSLHR